VIHSDRIRGCARVCRWPQQYWRQIKQCGQCRRPHSSSGQGSKAVVLDVEPDEPHIAAAKQANQAVRGVLDSLGLKSPLL
jgi:hypothetical protein